MPNRSLSIFLLLCLLCWLPPPVQAAGPGRVEQEFSRRAGEPLRLYGHGLFAEAPAGRPPALGSAADSHVLGPGDEVLVVLRGLVSGVSRHRIGVDGLLLVNDLPPLPAAGKTLGALRAEFDALVATGLSQTSGHLSLAEARRLSVLVVGEVARPGPQEVPAFASVLDGLAAAGGVLAGGSLRAIRLVRPGGDPAGVPVDLYELLRDGAGAATERLRDGDRLVVPPLGPVVAVAGRVARPALYELPADGRPATLAGLLDLAGGALDAGPPAAVRLHAGPDGSERSAIVTDPDRPLFRSGDILLYGTRRPDRLDTVELAGHVRQPGPRPLSAGGRLSGLLAEADLLPDAYRPFAVAVGIDPTTGSRRLEAVDLEAVLDGRDGPSLAGGGRLLVLGPADISYLGSRQVLSLLAGPPIPPGEDCPGLSALAATLSADPEGVLARGRWPRPRPACRGHPCPAPTFSRRSPTCCPSPWPMQGCCAGACCGPAPTLPPRALARPGWSRRPAAPAPRSGKPARGRSWMPALRGWSWRGPCGCRACGTCRRHRPCAPCCGTGRRWPPTPMGC
ncbi:hypothetical protein HHL28_02770 [Aerophototrophica crusticola]|uniref:Soluble ligand binding domain-containing protein n=1 Tax=Aerophototrophica crusticola TaxID=1709002 RepID=A0A858R458_9PROT|nr:hypothetical protein HHL28_02770 [Rhodospirillaceae bacterium B3]